MDHRLMDHNKLQEWFESMGLEDWGVLPVLPVFKDRFAFCFVTNGNHSDAGEIKIYIGHDHKLYIKAGGDWDYEWELDPAKNIHSYDWLRFLIMGK